MFKVGSEMLRKTLKCSVIIVIIAAVLMSNFGIAAAAVNKIGVTSVKGITSVKDVTSARDVTSVEGITSVRNVTFNVIQGSKYTLPAVITVVMSDKSKKQLGVKWLPATAKTGAVGKYRFTGTIAGYSKKVYLTLNVIPYIKAIADLNFEIRETDKPVLPKLVKAVMSNKTIASVPVKWESVSIFKYAGKVAGYQKPVNLTFTIKPSIVTVADVEIAVKDTDNIKLPGTVKATMSNGKVLDVPVVWTPGTVFKHIGKVDGYGKKVYLNIKLETAAGTSAGTSGGTGAGTAENKSAGSTTVTSANKSAGNTTGTSANNTAGSTEAAITIDNEKIPGGSATGTVKALEPAEISKLSGSAVVYIEVSDKNNKPLGTGSGFIVNSSGYIVTNYHVIDKAYTARVKLIDGRKFSVVNVIAYDEEKDIAILKVNASGLPAVKLGDSDNIRNGDKIVAIGSPLGFDNTISDGLVSYKNRIIDEMSYIQISAPVSPGSSGGALFNTRAEVIGVISATVVQGQNINLAIPVNLVKAYMNNTPAPKTLEEVYEEVYPTLSYSDLSDYLYLVHSSRKIGGYEVDLSYIKVMESTKDSNTVLILMKLDSDNYAKYLSGLLKDYPANQSVVENWAKDLFNIVKENFPDKNLAGGFAFMGSFLTYPDEYKTDEVTYVTETKMWDVIHMELVFFSDANKDVVFVWDK